VSRLVLVGATISLALAACTASEEPSEDPVTLPEIKFKGVAGEQPTDPEAPPSRAVDALAIVPRAEWGSKETIPERMRKHGVPFAHVTLHHTASHTTAGMDEPAILRSIQRYHQSGDRGWGDLAYHYLIGPSGMIYEGRDLRYAADTTTNYDPAGHVTVCLLGSFEEQQPTESALDSTVLLVAALLHDYRLTPEALTTHRRVAATLCPGANFDAWLVECGDGQIQHALDDLYGP